MTKIVILGTGGTIAGTATSASDNIGYTAAQVGVRELVDAVPGLSASVAQGVELVVEQIAQVDSKDMDFSVWQQLVVRCATLLADEDVTGIVITHGTDTIEETAYFLHAMLAPAKPLVLTCAMRPASSLSPDGPQNLIDAVTVAGMPGARGVVVVCAGAIHGAVEVRKIHPYRTDAFSSGDGGPLGWVEVLPRLVRPWPDSVKVSRVPAVQSLAETSAAAWPRVYIVLSHAGACGELPEALAGMGARGIVVAATGNGTVHRSLEASLQRIKTQGVKVLRASRCPEGRIWPRPDDVLDAVEGLSPVKARIALMLELMADEDAIARP
ncbi:MAG: asparaginase [Pseudomonadota bacterium]